MLNIYRVISLSLVMSLFFAAPLLCIQPVSYKLRERQVAAAEDSRSEKVRVFWERGTHPPRVKAAAALATSLQRSVHNANELRHQSEERGATPALFVQEQDEDWDNHESTEPDVGKVNGVDASSHTHRYY